jgi:exopolysaccharide biosynthesis WecB/TagA/CpsF family protein
MRDGQTDADKVFLFGVGISVTNYCKSRQVIMGAAREGRSLAVSALATHGLTEAARDSSFRDVVNSIDLVTPDGQPVRWAMNALYGTGLTDRVYGPDLVAEVCSAAAREGMSVYLFGSSAATCSAVADELPRRYPGLRIAGLQADRFREATLEEDQQDVDRICASGADIVLVGRGCPRQERWVASHRGVVAAPMLAVGAAFDYIAGNLVRPPAWVQRAGLEWFFRLCQEPRRLARRYVVHNALFCLLIAREVIRKKPSALRR